MFQRDYSCAFFAPLVLCAQIDREENFASQLEDGSKGKTELVSFELKQKYKLSSSVHRDGKGKTELTRRHGIAGFAAEAHR